MFIILVISFMSGSHIIIPLYHHFFMYQLFASTNKTNISRKIAAVIDECIEDSYRIAGSIGARVHGNMQVCLRSEISLEVILSLHI